ncbi:DUF6238 family protein [Streptomyces sp. NBC_00825]|uniref:DUF6238 family protein n=1 Tax=unclassified Streptomyces TaxID=2593676 RepID=UPI002ED66BF2|nr:DUF6238 family protein [Streptomyces sp. NBC_00826]WTH89243.1 DUF6238 family protein [Streptomyces sp. NBC_00825]WTH97968.1 DUF6238 family protein [Streptomyces sp. NBC_00822]
MTSPPRADDAHPYLRAATAGVRHHTHALGQSALPEPADRLHLDVLHAHLTALLRLVDQLAGAARPPHPGAGRHLASAHTRLWQATAALHDAFHLLPSAAAGFSECRPESLPEGPPFMTICQRHLAAGHIVRRKTTPTDLDRPPHITACLR